MTAGWLIGIILEESKIPEVPHKQKPSYTLYGFFEEETYFKEKFVHNGHGNH